MRFAITMLVASVILGSLAFGAGYALGVRTGDAELAELERKLTDAESRADIEHERADAALERVRSAVQKLNADLGAVLGSGRSIRDQLRELTRIHDTLGRFIESIGGGSIE